MKKLIMTVMIAAGLISQSASADEQAVWSISGIEIVLSEGSSSLLQEKLIDHRWEVICFLKK